ncbi:MAG: HEPN domain-containing protein [Imperialibacter sp.]|uniref:HEPN domain-containing protein n=1 Tax=Imperialibacter sp. TaxID=2038411 RepID=UPI0032EFBC6B
MHEFFTLSKNDLRTSGILYDEKLYTNSLYHYHQGVEKAVKGICLSIGGISERDLKSISHDPLNAYKILTKYLVTKSEGLLSPFNEHLFTNLRQMLELQTEAEIVANAWQLMNGVLNEEKTIKEEDFPTPF